MSGSSIQLTLEFIENQAIKMVPIGIRYQRISLTGSRVPTGDIQEVSL